MPENRPKWAVSFSSKAAKQAKNLPAGIAPALHLLVADLALSGPCLAHWRNYGVLAGRKKLHHCHLNGGKPRYVAVWRVEDKVLRIMEIIYVGTHEGARYGRMG